MKVYINTIPRTGSTVIAQICREFGCVVQKDHTAVNLKRGKTITTIRDPLFVIKSAISTKCKVSLAFTIERMNSWIGNKYHTLESNDNDLLVLRYEDYIENPKQRIRDIGDFLGVSYDEKMVDMIHEKTSIEKNRKISDSLSNFHACDTASSIHGNHINDPLQKKNDLNEIPQEYHEMIMNFRKKFGYE